MFQIIKFNPLDDIGANSNADQTVNKTSNLLGQVNSIRIPNIISLHTQQPQQLVSVSTPSTSKQTSNEPKLVTNQIVNMTKTETDGNNVTVINLPNIIMSGSTVYTG